MNYEKAAADAVNWTRRLSNVRATECDPAYMEKVIRDLVKDQPNISIEMIKGNELLDKGMNLHYEVGKGAEEAPRYMAVTYKGNANSEDIDIALVGKGLTFDTGGLNIKKSSMEEMYLDKTGAAAVLGSLKATLELEPNKNVVFAVGIAENAIGARVYKPGDIIKSLKGLTVEIGNTDAEGRLVLADAITYTCRKYKPKRLIDIASLTGSIMVALGETTAGLYSNNDQLADELLAAGKETGEELWRMPITDEHKDTIKREAADLNNCGKIKWGDGNHAAAFLERFLEKDVKWAHLDIAGTCINKKIGCTGFGVQVLLDAIHKS